MDTKIHASPDVMQKIERMIVDRLRASISDLEYRNGNMQYFRDLASGNLEPSSTPYYGACDINSTIIQEAVVTVSAFLNSVLAKNPPLIISSMEYDQTDDTDEDCRRLESFITNSFYDSGYFDVQSMLIQDSLILPYAVAMLSWKESSETEIVKARAGVDTGYIYEEGDEPEDEELGPEQMFAHEVGHSAGVSVESIDPQNFYYYPADAASVELSDGCGHRVWMSVERLYDMIGPLELDRDKTLECIEKSYSAAAIGTGHTETLRNQSVDNLPPGMAEIFFWFCKAPLVIEQGEIITPDTILGMNLMCVIDVRNNKMLKCVHSPYQGVFPYSTFTVYKQSHRMEGVGIAELLEPLQLLSSAELRLYIDSVSFRSCPVLKVNKKHRDKELGSQTVGPGAIFYVDDPNDVVPLQMAGTQEALGLASYAKNSADQLYASGGIGTLPTKVRRNAEIEAAQSSLSSKLNFWKKNFQMGMKDLAQKLVAIHDMFSVDQKVFRDPVTGEQLQITSDTLKRSYIFAPYADEQNSDPSTRLEVSKALSKYVQEYFAISANPQIPHETKMSMYRVTQRILQDLGIHNPKEFIGMEPQKEEAQPEAAPGLNPFGGAPNIQLPPGAALPPQGIPIG